MSNPELSIDSVFLYVPSPDGTGFVGVKKASNSKWTLPGGGINEGESVVVAGGRELREECGLTLTEVTGVVGVYRYQRRVGNKWYIRAILVAKAEGSIKPGLPEIMKAEYLQYDRALRLLNEGQFCRVGLHREALRDLAARGVTPSENIDHFQV